MQWQSLSSGQRPTNDTFLTQRPWCWNDDGHDAPIQLGVNKHGDGSATQRRTFMKVICGDITPPLASTLLLPCRPAAHVLLTAGCSPSGSRGGGGCWSLPSSQRVSGRNPPWTGRQAISGHTSLTYTYNWRSCFRLWQENIKPTGRTRKLLRQSNQNPRVSRQLLIVLKLVIHSVALLENHSDNPVGRSSRPHAGHRDSGLSITDVIFW